MGTPERFYVSIAGPGPDEEAQAIGIGLHWLQERAKRDSAREAVLAIPSMWQLQPGNTVVRVLGDDVAKRLTGKKRPVTIGGAQLRVITDKGAHFLYFQSPTPVLCVYSSMRMLNALDDGANISAICLATPHVHNQQWIDTWNPTDVRTGARYATEAGPPLDPVLQAALDDLTVLVNVSTGLSGADDRDTCIEIFRLLRRHRVAYDPDEVRRYLMSQKGWRPPGADEARDIASGVLAGRRFRIRWGPRLRSDIVQQWRQQAKEQRGRKGHE
jgi:hypothetical protein